MPRCRDTDLSVGMPLIDPLLLQRLPNLCWVNFGNVCSISLENDGDSSVRTVRKNCRSSSIMDIAFHGCRRVDHHKDRVASEM